jgi:uncharacterized protein (DUF2062 family)
MEKLWVRLARMSRYTYLRIVRIKAPADSIALGLALGVFAGALPLLSLQMAIAVSLALLLRANVVAAALGTWWSNPFNWAIVFPVFYMLGKIFVPMDVPALSIHELIHLPFLELVQRGWQWLLITTLGGAIAGIPLAVVTYFATLRAVRVYHNRRARRKLERQRRGVRRG